MYAPTQIMLPFRELISEEEEEEEALPPTPPAFLVRPLFDVPTLEVGIDGEVVLGRNAACRITNQALGGIGKSVSRCHAILRAVGSGISDLQQQQPVLEAELHSATYLQRWHAADEQQGEPARHGEAQKLQAGSIVGLCAHDCLYLLKREGHLLFGFQVHPLPAAPPPEPEVVVIDDDDDESEAAEKQPSSTAQDEQPMASAAAVETPAAVRTKRSSGSTGVEDEEGVPPAKRAWLHEGGGRGLAAAEVVVPTGAAVPAELPEAEQAQALAEQDEAEGQKQNVEVVPLGQQPTEGELPEQQVDEKEGQKEPSPSYIPL